MTPIEVRNAIEACGYDLGQHNNALASIHGVLKRLAESGEAEQVPHDVKGTLYRWKKPYVVVHLQPPDEDEVPTFGDSLRKAAGLPPQRRKSALQDYAEKLNKKEEKE